MDKSTQVINIGVGFNWLDAAYDMVDGMAVHGQTLKADEVFQAVEDMMQQAMLNWQNLQVMQFSGEGASCFLSWFLTQEGEKRVLAVPGRPRGRAKRR